MSSLNNGSTSTSDGKQRYDMMDEKKRKRMISNRDSARRSRMRKQKLVQELADEVSRLQDESRGIVGQIDEITQRCRVFAEENNVLKAQMMELNERLRLLNDLVESCGFAVDAPDVADPLLKPWQIPFPMQPIPASSASFKF